MDSYVRTFLVLTCTCFIQQIIGEYHTDQLGNIRIRYYVPHDKISSSDGIDCQNGGTQINSNTCLCPGGLFGTRCSHSLYISFDRIDSGITLMQGTERSDLNAAFVRGPINSAVRLDRSLRQWIDLGFHPDACMTNRYGCGAVGGAMSFWLRLNDCLSSTGIITTRKYPENVDGFGSGFGTGFQVFCMDGPDNLEYFLILPNGYNSAQRVPNKIGLHFWFHIVYNIIEPHNGQGFRIYHGGIQVANITRIHRGRSAAEDGRLVIGRKFTDRNSFYSSFEIDDLMFFNQAVNDDEIRMMSN